LFVLYEGAVYKFIKIHLAKKELKGGMMSRVTKLVASSLRNYKLVSLHFVDIHSYVFLDFDVVVGGHGCRPPSGIKLHSLLSKYSVYQMSEFHAGLR
jgi:hypothetical protein